MSEKRKYIRYSCTIETEYECRIGSPDEIEAGKGESQSGKGMVLDISKGGLFLVTNDRVPVSMPIRVTLKEKNMEVQGYINRTGLLENNPTEIAKKYASFKQYGDSYIAVEFDSPLENVEEIIK